MEAMFQGCKLAEAWETVASLAFGEEISWWTKSTLSQRVAACCAEQQKWLSNITHTYSLALCRNSGFPTLMGHSLHLQPPVSLEESTINNHKDLCCWMVTLPWVTAVWNHSLGLLQGANPPILLEPASAGDKWLLKMRSCNCSKMLLILIN